MSQAGPGRRYDQFPATALPDGARLRHGPEVWGALEELALRRGAPALLALDAYPGVDTSELVDYATKHLPQFDVVDIEVFAAKSSEELNEMLSGYLTDDPVFGVMSALDVTEFFDLSKLSALTSLVAERDRPTIVVGWGASLVTSGPQVVVLADMPRWEIQLRQRAGASNWRAENSEAGAREKFKRGYFVEWRSADLHKMAIQDRIDFILDTSRGCDDATMIDIGDYRQALLALTRQPFRVVPFFDPGVWGGEWMRERFHLDDSPPNFAWCFDCVPEENSLRFQSGDRFFEFPALNLVLSHPRELLGDEVFNRFGAEFPIRFDMLDTMGGQNLSLQVHPLREYIQEHFGMTYTQDESYYILDATSSSTVYLGVKEDVDQAAMLDDLSRAENGELSFPAEKYVNRFPVKRHDHVSIPAGTIHCSGADTMVLEISATPYIFTFKLWDWDRTDLDGKPRPIHFQHGAANIQWDRDTTWVSSNLIHTSSSSLETDFNVEERTGLHELEFLETHRAWFNEAIDLDTHHTVTVMTLVEGDVIEIRSPQAHFPPLTLGFGETVVLPAGVGAFTLNRCEQSRASRFGTIRAWVRSQ